MIRRYLSLLSFVAICFAFAGYCWAEEEIENLLQNADFEAFNNAPWTMWVEDQGNTMAMMIISDEEFLSGEQSMLIDISKKGSGKRVELHQNPLVLKKGQKLTYAFWAKTEEGELRTAKMRCNRRADPWTTYGQKLDCKITDEWTEFWVTFTMPADDNIAGIYVELIDTEGLVWLDHFRLYEGDYIEEDFEGKPDMSVKPYSKMISMWAAIKAVR